MGIMFRIEDNTFDLVILSHIPEHVEYPRKLLYEAVKVAKYVFVEVPLENNIKLRKDFVLDRVGHINFYSPMTIRLLVQSNDLEILSLRITNSSYRIYAFAAGQWASPSTCLSR